jgi:hypothetical protein
MKYIGNFFKSILNLILIVLFSTVLALGGLLFSIFIIPFAIIGWFISLFYEGGLDALTDKINQNFIMNDTDNKMDPDNIEIVNENKEEETNND